MQLNKPDGQSVGWAVFVRVTHWIVALCVLVNFFNDTGFWHRAIGYGCLVLVLIRIIYGICISKVPSSKLHMPGIQSLKVHFQELLHQQVPSYIGHNPFGQWAVYIMWLLIALLAASGWLSRTDALWGEDWPVDLHMVLSNVLQGVVVVHLFAVLLMSKLQKHNLVKAMIVGRKI